jgi:sec-independent protein translocase protein TatA
MPLPNGFEWIVILAIALLILGPGKLPDVASALGKSIREFRKASSDVQESIKGETATPPATPATSTAQAAPPAPVGDAAATVPAAPATPSPSSTEATTESR